MTEWRTIPEFPNYAVSDEGEVARVRPSARHHSVTGRPLRAVASPGGRYLVVTLCHEGQRQQFRINRLVCEAFHGPAPSEKHHAAHNDGNKANNRASNLRWATPAENEADKALHGTGPQGDRHWSRRQPARRARGERHGKTRLTESDIRSIRRDGRARTELATAYGVHKATIGNILSRRTWGHVQ